MASPNQTSNPSKQKKSRANPKKHYGDSVSPQNSINIPNQAIADSSEASESSEPSDPSKSSNNHTQPDQSEVNATDNEDYDEDDDDDYDPSKKADTREEEEEEDSDASDGENQPDYSAITTEVSQVRTRNQIYKESTTSKYGASYGKGLLKSDSRINIEDVFKNLQSAPATDDWVTMVKGPSEDTSVEKHKKFEAEKLILAEKKSEPEEKIRIFTTYTFAGKLVREEKIVDANSAEAKAYLNSTNGLASSKEDSGPRRSYVTVMRKIPGSKDDTEHPLRIKLKRPSLIDKFLLGDKRNKLTTLEKSRLDWASFVDKKKLKDDLAIHNKGGYLEKQDFLGRMEHKRDTKYQQAKELERQRQWQQQQQSQRS